MNDQRDDDLAQLVSVRTNPRRPALRKRCAAITVQSKADLTTLAGIETELADTTDYDISKAKQCLAPLGRKLDFARSTRGGFARAR